MIDGNDHSEHVEAWLRTAPRGRAIEPLLVSFELALSAIIRRAQQTLGELTVTAILDRVVYLAAEKFPLASAMKVESTGVSCRALLELGDARERHDVVEPIRFILIAFLTLLGNLTAEVLTPALHAELVREDDASNDADSMAACSVGRRKRDEGVAS